MELSDRENNLGQTLIGILKSLASPVPGLGQAIAGWDNYQRSNFERNIKKAIELLEERATNIETLFTNEWLKTDEGQIFSRKIFDCVFDIQLEDKQELFINSFVNGVENADKIEDLEKLKFVDMLRHMSRASLMVLAEMHKIFVKDVRGPNRNPDSIQSFPAIQPERLSSELSNIFHPYLIYSAIKEMEGQGLFSNVGDWRKDDSGKYRQVGGFLNENCYTDFAARFVEFITINEI